eukprot:comp65420_c0_seq1/m.47994 comp65420_c0_seq1/g.47994  ORF comp65420_c0_seq1/g.47994 comp65420_c0_seq1/m.47994 type:complete len:277 (-) comp65420_c0_seq1:410-1240(-)
MFASRARALLSKRAALAAGGAATLGLFLAQPDVIFTEGRWGPIAPVDNTVGPDQRGSTKRYATSTWDSNWDKRQGTSPESKDYAIVRHIYLVRHGQYRTTPDGKDALTDLGRLQADLTGRSLAIKGLKFDAVYYSTMNRAVETCRIIAKHLPPSPTQGSELLEEGAPVSPVPASALWTPADDEFFIDGARIEAAFRRYFYRPPPTQKGSTHELIVCHGNVIRYFVCRALQIPPEFWLRMTVFNCGVTRIDIYANGRVQIKTMGDIGHIPPEHQTFT